MVAIPDSSDRQDAIERVKKNAPKWFADVFDFMLKDLNRIGDCSKQVTSCQIQCKRKEIQVLHRQVEELEKGNSDL